jgi:hypothetical protein
VRAGCPIGDRFPVFSDPGKGIAPTKPETPPVRVLVRSTGGFGISTPLACHGGAAIRPTEMTTNAKRNQRGGGPCRRRWWLGAGSNRRHCDFQSHALPTELPSRTEERESNSVRPAFGKTVFRDFLGRPPWRYFGSWFARSSSGVTVETTPPFGTSTWAIQSSAFRNTLRKFSSPQFLW